MMLLLAGDVIPHGLSLGFTDGKCPISRLPSKCGKLLALGLDPLRGRFLDLLNGRADGDGTGQMEEDMNVIIDRIDDVGRADEILKNGCHVGMQDGAHRIGDETFTMLGAEDKMNVEASEGLRHDNSPGRCPGLSLDTPVGAANHDSCDSVARILPSHFRDSVAEM